MISDSAKVSNSENSVATRYLSFDRSFKRSLYTNILPLLFDLDESKSNALAQLHKRINSKVVELTKEDTLKNRPKMEGNRFICKNHEFALSEESWVELNTFIKYEVLTTRTASVYLAKLLPGDAMILHKILNKLAKQPKTVYAALTHFYSQAANDTIRHLMKFIYVSFSKPILEYNLQWSISKDLYRGIYSFFPKKKVEYALSRDLSEDSASWDFIEALLLENALGISKSSVKYYYYLFPNFTRLTPNSNTIFSISLLLTVLVHYFERVLASPKELLVEKSNISAIFIDRREKFGPLFANKEVPNDMLLYLNGIYSVLLNQWNYFSRILGIEITDILCSEGFITTNIHETPPEDKLE